MKTALIALAALCLTGCDVGTFRTFDEMKNEEVLVRDGTRLVTRFYDPQRQVTCWTISTGRGMAISCLGTTGPLVEAK